MYEAAVYNGEFKDTVDILIHINDRLLEQQREANGARQKIGSNAAKATPGAKAVESASTSKA